MKGRVDRIICDPPFLGEDCQTKGRVSLLLVKLLMLSLRAFADTNSCFDGSVVV